MDLYCTSAEADALRSFSGSRYGMTWTREELVKLFAYVKQRLSLKDVCNALGRPAAGVVIKLALPESPVAFDGIGNFYFKEGSAAAALEPAPKEEKAVEAKTIEQVTMIEGNDAKNMSDEQIFNLIAKLEGKKQKLESINNKPKKLVAAIEKTQADIDALVAYVDSRE